MKNNKCKHESKMPYWDYVKCNVCGCIRTDSGWGIASDMWFDNLPQANYYRANGHLPSHLERPER